MAICYIKQQKKHKINENLSYFIGISPIIPYTPSIPKISKYDNIKLHKTVIGKTTQTKPKFKKGIVIDINISKKIVTILNPKNNKTYNLNIDTVKVLD